MSEQRYIERSDRAFCDFCTDGDPAMTWRLPVGVRMNIHAVDPATKTIVQTSKDSDGMWSACAPCHAGIMKYRQSRVRVSALRRFVRGVWGRMTRLKDAYPDTPGAAKAIRLQQSVLFGRLLPLLFDPRPYDLTGVRVVIEASGTPEQIKATSKLREDINKMWEKSHPAQVDSTITTGETFEPTEPSSDAIVPPDDIPDGSTRGRGI